jgi:alpha-glucosidase
MRLQTSKHRWAEGAIVYQIYPRSFYDSNADGVGDIPGITKNLKHLKSLGVNAIWLSPFYPSPMADFGYDVADYCDVDPIFGSLKDMDQLIKQAHKKDIRIIVDLVPNHTSDEHEWFRQSRQSPEGPYADWYIWRGAKSTDASGNPVPPNNWVNVFNGKSAWEWEPSRQQFYLHSFHVAQPDLNWSNPKVREAIKHAMRFWLDKGVDGFRVDAVPFMAKDPQFRDDPKNPHYEAGHNPYNSVLHKNSMAWPAVHAYLAEMASVLKEPKYRTSERFMVTEGYPQTDDTVTEYLSYYEGMDPEVAAPFNFEGLSLPWKAEAWSDFLGRFHTALDDFSPLCVPSYAFGNHDQSRIVSRLGEAQARSAAVLLLTLPGMSFVYNGDEIGMHDVPIPAAFVQDPGAEGGDGRDPERTPLQWTSDQNAGFTKAHTSWLPIAANYKTVNIKTQSRDKTSFLNLYRTLGKLRNSSDALRYGRIEVIETGNKDVLVLSRGHGTDALIVCVNFSSNEQVVDLQLKLRKRLISSLPHPDKHLKDAIKLGPNEAAVFRG